MCFGSSLCEGKREAGEIPARSRRCVVEPPGNGPLVYGKAVGGEEAKSEYLPKAG